MAVLHGWFARPRVPRVREEATVLGFSVTAGEVDPKTLAFTLAHQLGSDGSCEDGRWGGIIARAGWSLVATDQDGQLSHVVFGNVPEALPQAAATGEQDALTGPPNRPETGTTVRTDCLACDRES